MSVCIPQVKRNVMYSTMCFLLSGDHIRFSEGGPKRELGGPNQFPSKINSAQLHVFSSLTCVRIIAKDIDLVGHYQEAFTKYKLHRRSGDVNTGITPPVEHFSCANS